MFLWHFPSSHLDRVLLGAVPYEARTFLSVSRAVTRIASRSNIIRDMNSIRQEVEKQAVTHYLFLMSNMAKCLYPILVN
jgi:hypothetical protein